MSGRVGAHFVCLCLCACVIVCACWCGCVGVLARVHHRVVLFGRVFLVALLQERNEILAAKIGDACAQAEPGKAVVAVLGTLSLFGKASFVVSQFFYLFL